MLNSFFGKICEDFWKRIDFKLVYQYGKFIKEILKLFFKGFCIFFDNLVGIEYVKVRFYFNKVINIGFCILDMLKIIIYDFYYSYMKKKYLGFKLKLLWMDIDSFGYFI